MRRTTGPDLLVGRSELELVLPPDAFIDFETALYAQHRAESHVAKGEWASAWGPAGVAYDITGGHHSLSGALP